MSNDPRTSSKHFAVLTLYRACMLASVMLATTPQAGCKKCILDIVGRLERRKGHGLVGRHVRVYMPHVPVQVGRVGRDGG